MKDKIIQLVPTLIEGETQILGLGESGDIYSMKPWVPFKWYLLQRSPKRDFIKWLLTQKDVDSPIGDLAKDTISSGFKGDSIEKLRQHIEITATNNGVSDTSHLEEALEEALDMFNDL